MAFHSPIISVIIPTLNRCQTLASALQSVRRQSISADQYEIIVVDNGSTDGTRELVERLNKDDQTPIIYVYEGQIGLQRARHTGARAAKGEILVFTDDDATVETDWLQAYVGAFAAHSEMVAAGGPVRPVWETPPPQWLLDYIGDAKIFPILSLMEPYCEFHLDRKGLLFGVNMAVRRSVFKYTGFRPELFETRTIGNGETGLQIEISLRGGLIGYVPAAVVYHHIPACRMSVAYIRKWAWHLGGSQMYTQWCNRRRTPVYLIKELLTIIQHNWLTWLKDHLVRHRRDPEAIRTQFSASLGWCKLNYVWWMLADPQVREALDLKDFRP